MCHNQWWMDQWWWINDGTQNAGRTLGGQENTHLWKYIKQNADETYLQSYQNSETKIRRTHKKRDGMNITFLMPHSERSWSSAPTKSIIKNREQVRLGRAGAELKNRKSKERNWQILGTQVSKLNTRSIKSSRINHKRTLITNVTKTCIPLANSL